MIAIKGLRQGLLIVFDSTVGTPWLSQLYELQRKIESSSNFFKGGRIAFDIKSFALTGEEIERARMMLAENDVTLWAIVSTDMPTCVLVQAAGLSVTLSDAPALVKSVPPPVAAEPVELSPDLEPANSSTLAADEVVETEPTAPVASEAAANTVEPSVARLPSDATVDTNVLALEAAPVPTEHDPANTIVVEGTDGLLVRKRVRSGQVLRHPGHIVVIGDVNPGAALIAGGDIIVWGRLQGSAHAGALGDENAVVCALDLMPSLLRIADATRVSSNEKRRQPKPETALLQEQQILLVAWTAGK